ncbi:hypothetical protein BQ8794_240261 [Mesorhizobium prunaredense]|uniref:Uncharacterized protein n=1 Tax=Mesorhizobium prunaredense TaxID=1631249 RepID=A0A1R3V854_9HYPH|nr:hypothetical protein BQ8794_240261 [Mesorhizobium prunaredense]
MQIRCARAASWKGVLSFELASSTANVLTSLMHVRTGKSRTAVGSPPGILCQIQFADRIHLVTRWFHKQDVEKTIFRKEGVLLAMKNLCR